MGLLDIILGLFGRKPAVDFGRLDPNDFETYYRADHELDQAARRGPADHAQVLARYGVRDTEHWDRIREAMYERHHANPEFTMASSRVNFQIQIDGMKGYSLPPGYLTPPYGITLDRYAAIRARFDLGQPAAAVLASYSLDDARWREVEQAWGGRMTPQGDAMAQMAGQILVSQYQVMYGLATKAYAAA